MKWTKEKPTTDGYYWFRDRGTFVFAAQGPVVVYIDESLDLWTYQSGTAAWEDFGTNVSELADRFEWAGPIPFPEEPAT